MGHRWTRKYSLNKDLVQWCCESCDGYKWTNGEDPPPEDVEIHLRNERFASCADAIIHEVQQT